jgi:HlyD family secretion protein
VTIRFFVPERQVALYRPGRVVRFACDSCPAGLTASISYVSPRPEYTPPVIYSLEARERLVFLVEARPAHPDRLTPGLPVDVTPLEAGR